MAPTRTGVSRARLRQLPAVLRQLLGIGSRDSIQGRNADFIADRAVAHGQSRNSASIECNSTKKERNGNHDCRSLAGTVKNEVRTEKTVKDQVLLDKKESARPLKGGR